jgi:hypothetical protein
MRADRSDGVCVRLHGDVRINWQRIFALWRASGRTPGTIQVYTYWARRYAEYCNAGGKPLLAELTRAKVQSFVTAEVRGRRRRIRSRGIYSVPCNAVRALSCAFRAMGADVPAWRVPAPRPAHPASVIVRGFVDYRLRHRGVARGTTWSDARVASAFLAFLRSRNRRVAAVRVTDLDDFVLGLTSKWALKTVAGTAVRCERCCDSCTRAVDCQSISPHVSLRRGFDRSIVLRERCHGATFAESCARSTCAARWAAATTRSS